MEDPVEILKALLPAIHKIDSGCSTCIRAFIEEANKGLRQAKIPYRYETTDGDPDDGTWIKVKSGTVFGE